MITVALIDKEELFADDISNFAISLDEQNKVIFIYHKNELIGKLKSICGISDEDFISKIKYKEN